MNTKQLKAINDILGTLAKRLEQATLEFYGVANSIKQIKEVLQLQERQQ